MNTLLGALALTVLATVAPVARTSTPAADARAGVCTSAHCTGSCPSAACAANSAECSANGCGGQSATASR